MNAAIEFLAVDLVYTDFVRRTRFCGDYDEHHKGLKLGDRLWSIFSFYKFHCQD